MKVILYCIALFLTIIAGIVIFNITNKDMTYASFAQCLADQDAKFYGAYWCPHCNNQKRMFEDASSLLPYIECSEKGGKGQLQICKDAGIAGYPTWVFADGTILKGTQSFETLSNATGCPLPKADR